MGRRVFSLTQSDYNPNESVTFYDRATRGIRLTDIATSSSGYYGTPYPNGVIAITPTGGALSLVGPEGVDDLWVQKFSGGSRTLLEGSSSSIGSEPGSGIIFLPTVTTASSSAATANTTEIQAAINAANTAGGGTVQLPPGVIYHTGLTLKSNVKILGAGRDATSLKLANGTNGDSLVGYQFATYTNSGDTAAGIYGWTLAELSIDGNKANQSGTGYGLRVYGYDFDIFNVSIHDAKTDGIWSEWANFGGASLPDKSMEARYYGLRIHDCGGNGWHNRGPHDSLAVNCIIFSNAGYAYWSEADQATQKYSAAGHLFVNSHFWGTHTIAAVLDTQTHFANCQLEGATTGQMLVRGGDCSFVGGFIFYLLGGSNTGYGVQVGDSGASLSCSGLNLNTKMEGFACTSAATAAIKIDSTGGNNVLRAEHYFTSGSTVISGSPSNLDTIELISQGQGLNTDAANSQRKYIGKLAIDAGSATTTAFTIKGNATDYFNVSIGSKRIDGPQGMLLRLYSDAYSTITTAFDGATGHWITGGGTPTVAAGGQAGASPPSPVAARYNDTSGNITFGTGTGSGAGEMVLITSAAAYGAAPKAFVNPRNAATAALGLYALVNNATSTISIKAANAPADSQANTVYGFDYFVVQ